MIHNTNTFSQIKHKVMSALMVLSLLVITGGAAMSDEVQALRDMQNGFIKVSEKASPAVVFIDVEKVVNQPAMMSPMDMFGNEFFEQFFGQGQRPDGKKGQRPQPQPKKELREHGQGSGFIISDDGYILTNNHVVGEADKVFVTLTDKREFQAKVIGSDPESDVAVIKIDTKEKLPILPLGDSDKIRVGEFSIAIGNPFGLSHTVTSGIISAKGRSNIGITDYEDLIQTDAAINPGNSGGPLINLDGEAIGINTAIFSRSGGYMGIGFAIPVNMAKAIFKQIKETGTVTRAYIGVYIQDITPQLAESFKLEINNGILVSAVEDNSPAKEAGLKQGDIILELNGDKVEKTTAFRNKVSLMSPGSKIDLKVLRDNEKKDISLTLAKKSKSVTESTVSGEKVTKSFGFSVQNLNDELSQHFGYENEKGVVVTEADEDSSAFRAGLRPGMLIKEVNRQAVNNLKEFNEAMKDSSDKGDILLLVKDPNGTRFIAFKADKNDKAAK